MNSIRLVYLLILIVIPLFSTAQKDSTKTPRTYPSDSLIYEDHLPGMAALYSVVPGGGQFYNRSYWKIPVIYASLFVVGDFVAKNHREYKSYKAEAINRYDNNIIAAYPDLSDEQVLYYKDEYEHRRNLSILIFLGVYLLNIVDATVDAHFFKFDVSPDVTFQAEPFIRPSDYNTTTPVQAGLTFSLKL